MTFGLCIEVLWVSGTDTGPGGVFCRSRRRNSVNGILFASKPNKALCFFGVSKINSVFIVMILEAIQFGIYISYVSKSVLIW